MRVDREEAARLASAYLTAHGAKVVPSFEGLVNNDNEWIVTFERCIFLNKDDAFFNKELWSVNFARLDPPGIVSSPGCAIVLVDPGTGSCAFFDSL
jgi:hypothetical protein